MEQILLNRLSAIVDEIDVLTTSALNISLDEENLVNAKITASKLQSILNRFQADLYNYFNKVTEPAAEEYISQFTASQLKGEETLAELNVKITTFTERTSVSSNQSNEASRSANSLISGKLPKLSLPEFDGKILEWHQFWDQFYSNIDQRNIPEVDKLLYLKASLKGDAKKLIDGLDSTNRNYSIAVLTLKERYGKESQVIDAHYAALNKIKRAEKTTECRKTLDNIERHLRVLSSLGENTNHNHLRSLITDKFPEDIIYEMKMKIKNESIEEMRDQLKLIITAKEDANKLTSERDYRDPANNFTVETLHVSNNFHNNRNSTVGQREHFNGKNRFQRWKPKEPTSFKRKPMEKPALKETRNSSFNNRYSSNNWKRNEPMHSTGNKYTRQNKRRSGQDGHQQEMKKRRLHCIFCQEAHYNEKCDKFKTLKDRKVQLRNKCYICFKIGHRALTCRSKVTCIHCNESVHNRALCPKLFSPKSESTSTLSTHHKGSTALQTAIVYVEDKDGKKIKGRLILDSGSQRSYVTAEFAKRLDMPIEEENLLSVFTFGSDRPQEHKSPLIRINIITNNNKTKSIFVNIVPMISQSVPCPKYTLNNLDLADDGSLLDRIDMLIGNDYYHSLMGKEKRKLDDNLYIVESELGWILSGEIRHKPTDELTVVTYFQTTIDEKLNHPDLPLDNGNIKFLWELESIGITDSPNVNRDEEAIKHFNENTRLIDNRYSVCWPWNEYPPDLPSNFGLAYGQLVSLLKRLDTEALNSYDATIRDQLDKSIIETVSTTEREEHTVHYLPHHGVRVQGKPTRIVYNASAKLKNSKSLNECLYCGPLMLHDLAGLLIKFRCHPIAISADIEKAFLQLSLNEKDRDVTRFLWLKDITRPATKDNLQHFRFKRVPFGIISSPFLLNAAIKYHLQNSNEEIIRKLSNEIYVDNIITGVSTVEQAIELYKKCKQTFQQISMNMREWSSNSRDFMKHIPDTCNEKIVKILGLDWNIESDTLHLRFKNTENANTKRGILKTIASVYDPHGLTIPYLLPAKVLLQDLWKRKLKWDETLLEEITTKWENIKTNLDEIKQLKIDRCLLNNPHNKCCQLHCFTDASTKAYAAAVYVVQDNHKSFVIGKSRLVPIKDKENLQIPRLELLGVVIGNRLINFVSKYIQLNVTQQIIWTDSQIVIDWYNTNKLLTPFVARRIDEIKRNKNITIRHVPTKLNPADVATRATDTNVEIQKWLNGPDFLLQEPSSWPVSAPQCTSFLAREDLPNSDLELVEEDMDMIPEKSGAIIDRCEEDKQRNDKEKKEMQQVYSEHSTLNEIKKIQTKHFPEEVAGKQTSLSRNLDLFSDIDGILRCGGRMKNADWSYESKHPILIPKLCDFTDQVIQRTHEDNYHVGVSHTLSLIRRKYWIPQGRAQVKKILKMCPQCIKHGGGPYKLPTTPALPSERVNFSVPFTFTGMDYFGPVFVEAPDARQKRWVCLFTCLAVRAIHLEIVNDLTAEECLLGVRRFVACRGKPTLIVSDNATQFKLLSEIFMDPHCVKNNIKWKFIPQLAPWHGGVYERLIAVVKNCLKRTLDKHLLKDGQLMTIMKEVETVVNSRPLTTVDSEIEHILRPADFLTLGSCLELIPPDETPLEGTSTKIDLVKSWKRGQRIVHEFKMMFRDRYLPCLRERYFQRPKQSRITSDKSPCIGDVVQIKDDSRNRLNWRVGRISALLEGQDGKCRVAKVQVGEQVFTRSIAHLYPLEVEETDSVITSSEQIQRFSDLDLQLNENEEKMETPEFTIEDNLNHLNKIEKSLEKGQKENKDETEHNTSKTTTETINEKEDSETNHGMDCEITEMNPEDANNIEERPRRAAAVRALEKIREWSSNLATILL